MRSKGILEKEESSLYSPIFNPVWNEAVLAELADWINGMAFRDFNFSATGKPVIKIAEIKNGISDQTKYSDAEYDDVYLIKDGDMLFCWSGQPETSIDTFYWHGDEGWLNQHIFKILPKKMCISRYFYFLLKYLKPNFIKIAKNKQTTGLGHVTKKDLERMRVRIPSISEQNAVTAVLSSFDDKIWLLQRQNKTISNLAKILYDQWFLKFNFPSKDGIAYRSGKGKMVETELGDIPEQWRVGKLTDIFDFMEGPGIRNWQYTEAGRRFINIRLIQDGDINVKDANFISEEEAESTYKHFHLQARDMVVSTSGTLGRSAIVRNEHLPLMLNTSVIRFRPIDGCSYGFMYQFLNSRFFQNELESLASGSVQLNFGPVHLKQIEMIIPSDDVLRMFSEVVDPLYRKMASNLSQIATLSGIGTCLLPKLMRGELKVKGFGG